MKINMHSSPANNLIQINNFLQLENTKFKSFDKKGSYQFIRDLVCNIKYNTLPKQSKGQAIEYISKILGYSHIQAKRLVKKAARGQLVDPKSTKNKTSFKKKYTDADIKLLAEFDKLANFPNGYSLIESFRRMYEEFHNKNFVRLAYISNGHVYNLRKTNLYRKTTLKFKHTKPISENHIGVREKPNPEGKPGYIRVDSVHGGDKGKEKGVYYVNLVDEVTQFEIVVCVQGISERYLREVWEEVLVSFPFRVINFHSDNGSEFINQIVVTILNKLNITQTKSRPRRHNDNGLVESKNGWVIRKHFGYFYVHRECASIINEYLDKYFNRFLNYHRPCAFPTRVQLPSGKIKVVYRKDDYKTPYAKLTDIDPKGKYLQEGFTYDTLDMIAYACSDYEYLKIMKDAQRKMLRKVRSKTKELLLTDFSSSVSF